MKLDPPEGWSPRAPKPAQSAEERRRDARARRVLGELGEAEAVAYAQTAAGLEVIARNWRTRAGELDVIACDRAARMLVFVEVRARWAHSGAWTPEATVDARKQAQVCRMAQAWLAAQPEGAWRGWRVRFDVMGVRVTRGARHHHGRVRHIVSAFDMGALGPA